MWVLYLSTFAWGGLGIGGALAMTFAQKGTLGAWWTISGIFSGGMLGLFLLGFLSEKTKNTAAIMGTVAGFFAILWMSLSLGGLLPKGFPKSPFQSYLIPVIGTLTILLTGFFVAILCHYKKSENFENAE